MKPLKPGEIFRFKGEPFIQALTKFGYSNIEEAKKDLAVRAHTSTQLSFRPNVVFTVMESMSGDIFTLMIHWPIIHWAH